MHSAPITDLDTDIVELVPFVPADDRAPMPLREVAFRTDAWLPDETAELRAAFAQDRSLDEMATAVGRTRASISRRLYDLGLRRHSLRGWTTWDDEDLARSYTDEPTATLAARLGRSVSALYARARMLGLSDPGPLPYSGWEDAQLRAGYERGIPVAQIATMIGRPFSGVVSRGSVLGLRHACQPDDWSDAETARALDLAATGARYMAIAATLAAEGFPTRNGRSLGQRLRRLGYGRGWGRPWIGEEDELLRHAYTTGASLTPLRERLGRSASSIRWRVEALGLRGTHINRNGFRQGPDWSDADNERLRRDYGKVPSRTLAAELGRGYRAMLIHANALGLVHGYHRAFSEEEKRAIRIAWSNGVSLTDLAQALGRDIAVVSKQAIRLQHRFSAPDRPAEAPRSRRANRPPMTLADILALPEQDNGRHAHPCP